MQAYAVTKRFKCRYTSKLYQPGQTYTPQDESEGRRLAAAGYLKEQDTQETAKEPQQAEEKPQQSRRGKKKRRRKRSRASGGDE